MAETSEAPKPKAARSHRFRRPKISDIVIFGVIIVIIVVLVGTIIGRLNLKHEVNAAQVVSDRVVAAMARADAAAIYRQGDKKFQADHTTAELTKDLSLANFAAIYGKTTPVVERQVVSNNAKRQYVVFIYRYDRLKVPFYIRIDAAKPAGDTAWHLQALSGNPDETQLGV